jgi:hypothetical protein
MVVFRGRMPAEQGQVVIRALEAARDELGPPPAEVADGLDPELAEDVLSPRARNADALLAVATTALSEKASSADVYQVVLHVDAGSLTTTREGKAAQNCQFDNGEPVSREAIRRLTCDAAIVPLLQQNGRTIDVGRKTRTISAALRRALQSRDHGCAFPGCSQRHHVDAHHIEHWADGGETNLDNCILLCRFHHMLLHRGRFAVRRAHRGFNWFRADGSPIPNAPRQPRGDCARVTDSTGAPARTTWSLFPEEPTPRGALLGWSVEALLESRDKCDSPPGLAVVGAPHP